MAKDFYHDNVRQALEKDGWRITGDPYRIKVDDAKILIYNPVQNEIVKWIK